MRTKYLYLLVSLIYSCGGQADRAADQGEKTSSQQKIRPEFQAILDSAQVQGAILIYDAQKSIYYSNDFIWSEKGTLPASTFKIVHSIIALETEVVKDDLTIFKWKGEKRAIKSWEQDLTLRDAFHLSCVPCYQDIARRIGVQRMREYLAKLHYGHIHVDSSNVDLFWLEGTSRISPFEQIDFLQRFYNAELSISDRTRTMMQKMMVIEENDDYKLSGKTGWSIDGGKNNGWFVGYLEKANAIYFFATNVEPEPDFNMDHFPAIRKEVTFQALRAINVLH